MSADLPEPYVTQLKFSDYIVYVDESGDSNLRQFDAKYPVFVLALCVFKKHDYITRIVPAMQALKFKYFGHDSVVFHERDITKKIGPFKLLRHKAIGDSFFKELSEVMGAIDFEIIAVTLPKETIPDLRVSEVNGYHHAMQIGLERLGDLMRHKSEAGQQTFVIFESRGKDPDNNLKWNFEQHTKSDSNLGQQFEAAFVSKQANCTGIQIADLVAKPIGLNAIRPAQPNRAYEILKAKLIN